MWLLSCLGMMMAGAPAAGMTMTSTGGIPVSGLHMVSTAQPMGMVGMN